MESETRPETRTAETRPTKTRMTENRPTETRTPYDHTPTVAIPAGLRQRHRAYKHHHGD